MLLDDPQWSHEASLDRLTHLPKTPSLPLTLVLAAQRELLDRRLTWAAGAARHVSVTLGALDDRERQALTGVLQACFRPGSMH